MYSSDKSPRVEVWGVPDFEVSVLDPLLISAKYGRIINRGPYINGLVPVRAVLHTPTARDDIYRLHLAVVAGERMFAQAVDFRQEEHQLVFNGILKTCGVSGYWY